MTGATSTSPPDQTPRPVLEERLESIERALTLLSAELHEIRAELDRGARSATLNGSPAPGVHSGSTYSPPAERPAARRRRTQPDGSLDFERILGRYGMLGIAVLTAVAAVGTFLSWAISRGYLQLGPAARVSIGLAAATGLAVWGLRLRIRERSFGSSVLGLALVIMQVCAYAAGPGFHLVSVPVAFTIVAFLSWVLAAFAHSEGDEPLFCVGLGGAALAPFVTSDGHGQLALLLVYGLMVLLTASFAISDREWGVGWRVFYGVAALFTLAGANLVRGALAPERFVAAIAFPLVVAAAGVTPFAAERYKRGAMRWLAALAAMVGLVLYGRTDTARLIEVTAVMATIAAWLWLVDHHGETPQSSIVWNAAQQGTTLDWLDAAAIPLALSLEAVAPFVRVTERWPVFAVATLIVGLFAFRRGVGSLRDASAFSAVALACGLVLTLSLETPLGRIAAFTALGVATLGAHRARPSLSWLIMAVLTLVIAGVLAISALIGRIPYAGPPFQSEATLGAAVVTAGLILVARFWPTLRVATRTAMGDRPEWSYAESMRILLRAATAAPWVWTFVWVMIELAMAYSRSASTLLLVVYFAATAVACVWTGRAGRSARLRQIGLGLALVATGTAFYGASTYFDFAARIGAYLVTSAFLLGIAYWYRRPGTAAAA